MASVRIGAESGSAFVTFAGSVSRGKRPTIGAILSRTSWTATLMSFSRSKVIVVFELPCPDIVLSSSMPSILLTVSSTRLVICDSTSSGLAPFNRIMMLTVGGSVLGIKSTPRSRYENTPNTTRATDIMIANTGRRMQTSASVTYYLLRVARFHFPCGHHVRHGVDRRFLHPELSRWGRHRRPVQLLRRSRRGFRVHRHRWKQS